MADYSCVPLEADLLDATEREWEHQLEEHAEEVDPGSVRKAISYARQSLEGAEPHTEIYAFRQDGDGYARALLEFKLRPTRENPRA